MVVMVVVCDCYDGGGGGGGGSGETRAYSNPSTHLLHAFMHGQAETKCAQLEQKLRDVEEKEIAIAQSAGMCRVCVCARACEGMWQIKHIKASPLPQRHLFII